MQKELGYGNDVMAEDDTNNQEKKYVKEKKEGLCA